MLNTKTLAAGAIVTSLALAGCTATGGATGPEQPANDCGAAALQDKIGQPVTGTTAADVRVGGEPVQSLGSVRVVGPNDQMTMDFREDRLTIETDAAGNLVSARCV